MNILINTKLIVRGGYVVLEPQLPGERDFSRVLENSDFLQRNGLRIDATSGYCINKEGPVAHIPHDVATIFTLTKPKYAQHITIYNPKEDNKALLGKWDALNGSTFQDCITLGNRIYLTGEYLAIPTYSKAFEILRKDYPVTNKDMYSPYPEYNGHISIFKVSK
jgi:hypothetical protein